MPKEVAYRMIKDDLSLDGNPMLKWVYIPLTFRHILTFYSLASFVTSKSINHNLCAVQSKVICV